MAVVWRIRESFMALPNRKVLAMNAAPIMMAMPAGMSMRLVLRISFNVMDHMVLLFLLLSRISTSASVAWQGGRNAAGRFTFLHQQFAHEVRRRLVRIGNDASIREYDGSVCV